MKLTSTDILKIRTGLQASKLVGLESVVFHKGLISGLGAAKNGVVFSACELSIDPEISIGIVKLAELEKRLGLFGDDVLIEGDVTDTMKTRRLSIKGKSGKIDFRCTDEKLIKYPKSANDTVGAVLTFSKAEVALIVKGAKTLGSEQLTLQVTKDGAIHIECADTNNDRFETDIELPAQFIEDEYSSVNSYQTNSSGVFLSMLEHLVKDSDQAVLELMKTGNIGMKCFGYDTLAIPRIDI